MAELDSTRTRVLAAVVKRDDRYLIGRRPLTKRHGGLWEFPGGKLEAGESLLMAARRELEEELAVVVVGVSEPVLRISDPGSIFDIEFVPTLIEGTPRCIEHSELAWVKTRELTNFSLAPSDRQFAEYLVRDGLGLDSRPNA